MSPLARIRPLDAGETRGKEGDGLFDGLGCFIRALPPIVFGGLGGGFSAVTK
jgi:hypothetical protein